jgi:hypothetical protein
MGRRRSIERTTARRCPSVRKRPGLGELPAPGSGRPRAWLGGGAVTLLRRAPREVYRLYDEEAFVAGADQEERRESTATPPGGRRLRRIAGTTTLLAAMGATGGVIALSRVVSAGGADHPLPAGLFAGLGPTVPARVGTGRVWRHPRGARTRRHGAPIRQTGPVDEIGATAAHARATTIRRPSSKRAGIAATAGSQGTSAEVVTPAVSARATTVASAQSQPVTVAAATHAASPDRAAMAASSSQHSGQSEFGFEH